MNLCCGTIFHKKCCGTKPRKITKENTDGERCQTCVFKCKLCVSRGRAVTFRRLGAGCDPPQGVSDGTQCDSALPVKHTLITATQLTFSENLVCTKFLGPLNRALRSDLNYCWFDECLYRQCIHPPSLVAPCAPCGAGGGQRHDRLCGPFR